MLKCVINEKPVEYLLQGYFKKKDFNPYQKAYSRPLYSQGLGNTACSKYLKTTLKTLLTAYFRSSNTKCTLICTVVTVSALAQKLASTVFLYSALGATANRRQAR